MAADKPVRQFRKERVIAPFGLYARRFEDEILGDQEFMHDITFDFTANNSEVKHNILSTFFLKKEREVRAGYQTIQGMIDHIYSEGFHVTVKVYGLDFLFFGSLDVGDITFIQQYFAKIENADVILYLGTPIPMPAFHTMTFGEDTVHYFDLEKLTEENKHEAHLTTSSNSYKYSNDAGLVIAKQICAKIKPDLSNFTEREICLYLSKVIAYKQFCFIRDQFLKFEAVNSEELHVKVLLPLLKLPFTVRNKGECVIDVTLDDDLPEMWNSFLRYTVQLTQKKAQAWSSNMVNCYRIKLMTALHLVLSRINATPFTDVHSIADENALLKTKEFFVKVIYEKLKTISKDTVVHSNKSLTETSSNFPIVVVGKLETPLLFLVGINVTADDVMTEWWQKEESMELHTAMKSNFSVIALAVMVNSACNFSALDIEVAHYGKNKKNENVWSLRESYMTPAVDGITQEDDNLPPNAVFKENKRQQTDWQSDSSECREHCTMRSGRVARRFKKVVFGDSDSSSSS